MSKTMFYSYGGLRRSDMLSIHVFHYSLANEKGQSISAKLGHSYFAKMVKLTSLITCALLQFDMNILLRR